MSAIPSIPQFKHAGKSIYESLILTEWFPSAKEVKELLLKKEVYNFENSEVITRFDYKLSHGDIIRTGKRSFYQVI